MGKFDRGRRECNPDKKAKPSIPAVLLACGLAVTTFLGLEIAERRGYMEPVFKDLIALKDGIEKKLPGHQKDGKNNNTEHITSNY